jgi:hypothetical protein
MRYALFGVVAREQRHETANLLGLIHAWGTFLTTHASAQAVGSQYTRAAAAVERLSRLERSLQHCCEGLAGTEQRMAPVQEIGTVVQDIASASCTAAGVTWDVALPKDEVLIRGPVGELAVALAGVVRLASVDARHISLTVTADPLSARSPVARFLVSSARDVAFAAGSPPKPPRLLGVELDYAKAVATTFGGRTEGPAAESASSSNGWQVTLVVPRVARPTPR